MHLHLPGVSLLYIQPGCFCLVCECRLPTLTSLLLLPPSLDGAEVLLLQNVNGLLKVLQGQPQLLLLLLLLLGLLSLHGTHKGQCNTCSAQSQPRHDHILCIYSVA